MYSLSFLLEIYSGRTGECCLSEVRSRFIYYTHKHILVNTFETGAKKRRSIGAMRSFGSRKGLTQGKECDILKEYV
jgi:hypothetical protein